MYHPVSLLVLVAAASLLLSACNENKTASKEMSTAAVKVNGQPISVAEIELKTGMHQDDKKPRHVSEDQMTSIISMELLHQAAVESKLDEDEAVRARLANSRRSILAMAYMEKILAPIAKPNESEVKAYFDQHPERFAERRKYELQEFLIPPHAGMGDAIKAQLAKNSKYESFEKWLAQKGIPHAGNRLAVTTDSIPDDVLQKLQNAPVGGHIIREDKGAMNIIFVLSEQKQPVELAQVSQQVGNMLWEQRRKDALDNMVKQQRNKAKVEYVSPYTAKGLPPMPGRSDVQVSPQSIH